MNQIDKVRVKTQCEMLDKLAKHRIVAVPRPTGFGKTCMVTNLLTQKKYNNVLYVYPTEIIKSTVVDRYYEAVDDETEETYRSMGLIKGVTLVTYKKLSMLNVEDDKTEFTGYDLIIFDECHRLGAPFTLPKAFFLKEMNPTAHIVGLTATPNRSDSYDVIENYFEGQTVSPYTLHDAFNDGLYNRPVYCYLHGDEDHIDRSIQEEAFTAGEKIEDLNVSKVIKKKIIEIANLSDVSSNIKQTCKETLDTNYMKFICFFSSYAQLLEKSIKLTNWFQQAFPSHYIKTLEITTREFETKDVTRLNTLVHRNKGIDLILCVDMLNMGYHVKDISGIVMYRATGSDIIYPQQYGRILDSGSRSEHIVFDIVDNLHRKLKLNARKKRTNSIINDSSELTDLNLQCDDPAGAADTDEGESSRLSEDVVTTENSFDISDCQSDLAVQFSSSANKQWYNKTSNLDIRDLKLASCTATYREQIAKLVAEPMQVRCKEAFIAHFKRWCIANNYKYPVTNNELSTLYGVDKSDFVRYFADMLSKNNLDYPMRDAQKLLDIGRKRKDGLPMDIFAKWKNVSIRNILDLLGV